jgi:hypothetical protein
MSRNQPMIARPAADKCKPLHIGKYRRRITALQNSFLIPAAQKVAGLRISRSAEFKNFGAPVETGKE